MTKKTVAIVGAGPSGISAAKYCSQYSLCPTVFDMNDQPGGLWVPGSKIWDTLYCNFTKHSMVFSDFQWSKVKQNENKTNFYAHRAEIFNYLLSYIKYFELESFFKCSTRVDSVKPIADSRWQLIWTCLKDKEQNQSEFDFVIIASGFNSIPNDPNIENSSGFNGLIMHSDKYIANDERLKGKRVLVIGSSNSSVEITSDLVGYAESVSNLFSRPFWVIPKFIETTARDDNSKNIVAPRDFMFYTRDFVYSGQDKYKKYAKICPDQANKETCPPNLYICPNSKLPANFGVSEHYYKHVKDGNIVTYLNQAKRFVRSGLELKDGSIIEADVIIYCTGFKLTLPFFDDEILKKLKYRKNNYKNPIVLYNHTFQPDLKNMAFIFLTRGGFFTGMELQSKWAALVFSGQAQLPPKEAMEIVIAENEKKRDETHPSVQFPHGLYVEVVDSLAKEIGVYPDLHNEELENIFNHCLVQPANFIYPENKDYFYHTIQLGERIMNEGVERDEKC